ncbi:MAG: ABC transporter permease DevC, partial [Phycisphaerales bacterium]|nr:ABC transporter permease DevC [Phycisphaerales bacterium]
LAWLQLSRQKARLFVALAGIAFACILIFVQLGFQQALYDGSVRPHAAMDADLIMVNPQFQTFFAVRSFSRSRLYEALRVDGVESVNSLYVGKGSWKNPETKITRDILIFGINPYKPGIKLCSFDPSCLTHLGTALFDRNSRPEYGAIATSFEKSGTVHTEVNRVGIDVVGLFSMGASFSADGNIVVSDSTFLRFFSERPSDQIEVGLLKLRPGADVKSIQRDLNRMLAPAVRVLDRDEFANTEKEYWASSTGIGFIFGLGVVVGFVVGVVIVYQILSSDVVDHLPEYATLKAIGYTDNFLLRVILEEAGILAVFGFIPGAVIAAFLNQFAYEATLLPLSMPLERIVAVFAATVVMCMISAAVALRKLKDADPAELF